MSNTISRFQFSIVSYPHKDIALNYDRKTGLFEYRNREEFIGMNIDGPYRFICRSNPLEEQLITEVNGLSEDLTIDPILVEAFVKYVKQYCKHWKKEYSSDIIDGESWEFTLETDDFKFTSSGHHNWPGNFEVFCDKLMKMTGGKMF